MPRILRSPGSKSFRLEKVSVPNADVARCERRPGAWAVSRVYGDVTPVHSHENPVLWGRHHPLEIDNLPTRSRGALMSVCSDDDTLNGLVTFPSEAQLTGSHPVSA